MQNRESINLNVVARLGDLSPTEVMVEAYYGPIVNNGIQHGRQLKCMLITNRIPLPIIIQQTLKSLMVVSMDIHSA